MSDFDGLVWVWLHNNPGTIDGWGHRSAVERCVEILYDMHTTFILPQYHPQIHTPRQISVSNQCLIKCDWFVLTSPTSNDANITNLKRRKYNPIICLISEDLVDPYLRRFPSSKSLMLTLKVHVLLCGLSDNIW